MKQQHLLFVLGLLSILLSASMIIASFPAGNSSLVVKVNNENDEPVEGASVVLFATMDDLKANRNPIQSPKASDASGKAKFDLLEAKVYYVLAQKNQRTNGGDPTDALAPAKASQMLVVIPSEELEEDLEEGNIE
jgi:hypothetical protein